MMPASPAGTVTGSACSVPAPLTHPIGLMLRGARGRGVTYAALVRRRLSVMAVVVSLAAMFAAVGLPRPLLAGAAGCAAPALSPSPAATSSGGFHAIEPVRLMDTRTSEVVGAGCTAVLDLRSATAAAALPAGAEAVALNVTATDAPGRGLVTVYPCGSPRPSASNLNPRRLQPTANSVVVPIDSSGLICMYTYTSLNLIVDVTGWFGRFGDAYHSLGNHRLLDTRTVDLRPDGGSGPLLAAAEVRIPIVDLVAPAGATAVAINVTTTDALGPGFVTAYPCGGGRPDTSTVNYLAGEQRAGHTIIGLGDDGTICLWSYATVHVIVDVEGWFGGPLGASAFLRPIVGTRVLDTRVGIGGIDAKPAAGSTVRFDPANGARLPIGSTVALDVVSTEADGPGFLTLYPCGSPRPITSTVNAVVGTEATNVAFVDVDITGEVCIFAYSPMHVVIDVIGTFGPSGPLRALSVDGMPFSGAAFAPDQHDLAVRCAPGANTLTVHATAALGDVVSIATTGQPAPPGGPSAVASLGLQENDAFVVRAGPATGPAEEYWVRCLPHDFPPIQVLRSDVPEPGWYLTDDAFPSVESPYGHFVMILDAAGAPVWYQRVPAPSVNLTRLSDGSLAWVQLQGQGFGDGSHPNGAVEIHALDGTLLRQVRAVGSDIDHHDVTELANGDIVVVTYVQRAGVDLTSIGLGSDQLVWDSHLQEIDPAGHVVWTWRSEDHIPVGDSTFPTVFPGVPGVDLVHINSVQLAPDGDLIVSARHTDTVYKVRRNTAGDIVWRVGGRHSDVVFVGDPDGGFGRQHDAQLLPNGNLRVFDNRTGLPGAPRAAEYALDLAAHTATLVWSRSEPDVGVSFGVGSVRSLDDDTVITWGGSVNPVFTEVDARGREIQRLTMGGAFPYRVKKLPTASFDINALRATAGVASA
jgi:hypothetical protein